MVLTEVSNGYLVIQYDIEMERVVGDGEWEIRLLASEEGHHKGKMTTNSWLFVGDVTG